MKIRFTYSTGQYMRTMLATQSYSYLEACLSKIVIAEGRRPLRDSLWVSIEQLIDNQVYRALRVQL